jgi:uncharacterized peroxidase-related enzyme
MTNEDRSAVMNRPGSLFLSDVEEKPQPSLYADLISIAKASGSDYWGIWSLLAFRPKAAYHLVHLSQEIMRADAPIGSDLRELIAAYTSSLNQCEFCMKAHAAVAGWLYNDHELVENVLRDPETSSLADRDKAMLRFVRKVTLDSASIQKTDIEAVTAAGWEDSAIFCAISVCALFSFYNRFVAANGVAPVSDDAFRRLAKRMAEHGYVRE